MIENYETIKNYVLTLGDLEDNPKLELQIQSLIDECLAYCFRADVPEQMELVLANVIVSELKKRAMLGVDGDISSYSEGDMSVSFANSNSAAAKCLYNGKLEAFKQIIGVIKNV